MKAFTKSKYGGPEVLKLEEVEKPTPGEGMILVKVSANSANPADWHTLRGKPIFARFVFGLLKPKQKILGADFAGTVESVGMGVKQFKPGDRVFGETLEGGAFAEFISVSESVCALMPDSVDFPLMASVPIAGLTAWQALVTHGKVTPGESVLINGAAGGVGHFAVQVAKAQGAKVTAVCSSGNAGFVKSLGADHVIAHDKEKLTEHKGTYDLVVDVHGNLTHRDFKRLGRRGVMVGFTTLGNMMGVLLKKSFSRFPLTQFTAAANTSDLHKLGTLIRNGHVKPFIEKTYSYRQIPEAIGYIEGMRTRGKVVMVW